MLPLGHLAFTWGTLHALQRAGKFPDADYRLAALAALAPDALDKPLAMFVFRRSNAALLFGHTLLMHALVWLAAGRKRRQWLPYLLAFSGHLLEDRIWGFPQTFLWPLRGPSFHQWRHVGSPAAFLDAYRQVVRQEPKLIMFELLGLAILTWTIVERGWYRPARLIQLLREGR
jgi:hypothetical protein